jgi:putative tryptophan/tyrosine transport system substrate-binding protein
MKKGAALSILLAVMLVAVAVIAETQQPAKVPRIGFFVGGFAPAYASRIEAFRQGLHDLGYVEGKNIVVEYRYGERKEERFPELAAELIHLKVDVIVTSSTAGVLAAKKATTTIPIVLAGVSDPVGSGLVASLARPGANVTGLSLLAPELSGKG